MLTKKCILFTDIKGFTTKAEHSVGGAQAMQEYLEKLDILIRPVFTNSHGEIGYVQHGKIIKTIGDAYMVSFNDCNSAVQSALEVQRILKEYNKDRSTGEKYELRIGIHFGEVYEKPDSELIGDNVNIASRLESNAAPTGVLISEEVYNNLTPSHQKKFTRLSSPLIIKNHSSITAYYDTETGKPELEEQNHIPGSVSASIVVNIAEEKKDALLFLRIEKDKTKPDNNTEFTAKLEVRSDSAHKTIIEKINIKIHPKFFTELNNFNDHRRRISGPAARFPGQPETITEQLEQESSIGSNIYNTFFIGDIGKYFEKFWSLLKQGKIEKLLLVISSDSPEILNIPFEMMRSDSRDTASEPFVLARDSFLLTHTTEPNLAHFEIGGIESLAPPLKILFVSSLPDDLPEEARFLEMEKEQEKLIEALGDLVSKQKVFVEFLEIASLKEIEDKIKAGRHNIVHISGHAAHLKSQTEKAGYLYLENEEGKTSHVSGEDFAKALAKYNCVKLVMLSACETARAEDYGVSGALIKKGIPAVIGMRYPVNDASATEFTSQFYDGICKGSPLSESLFNARTHLSNAQKEELKKQQDKNKLIPSEWFTPFLYLNQNIDVLIDYQKKVGSTEYFFQKPQSLLIGGKYIGKGFVGRHKQIIALTTLFKSGEHCVCIYGQGGIGKTTLSIRFADNYEGGRYKIIQFGGAHTEITEKDILTTLADEAKALLGNKIVQIIENPIYSPLDKLSFLIENYLLKEKIIILFDNFEDNQKEPPGGGEKSYQTEITSESLREFLTHLCKNIPKNTYIIFTTRYKFTKPDIPPLNVTEMNFPDAYKLINRFKHLVQLTLKEKRDVHTRLGGHPRSLELLESYLISEKVNWHDVADKFPLVEDKMINQDLLLNMLWGKLGENEQNLLRYASVFRYLTAIESLIICTGSDEASVKASLSALNVRSLIYLEKEVDMFYVHRLTSTFVLSKKITLQDEKKQLHKKAAEYFENIKDEEGKKYVDNDLEARWHYLQAAEYDKAAELTFIVERYLTTRGYPQVSFDLVKEILDTKITEKNQSIAYHLLGILYHRFGNYDEAIKQYNKSLEIAEKIGDIAGVARSLHQIGTLYFDRGDYSAALKLFVQAYTIFSKIGSPDANIAARNIQKTKDKIPESEFEAVVGEAMMNDE